MIKKWLIVGLGNPGPEYMTTRHNVGFLFVDKLKYSKKKYIGNFIFKDNYEFFELRDPSIPTCIVAKPLTCMNLSGIAVLELVKEYGISLHRVIVVHDELDIPLGRMKLKFSGGAAGHRGIKSIIEKLGTKDFYRLRIGIGRPPLDSSFSIKEWVLSPFSKQEFSILEDVLIEAIKGIYVFFREGVDIGVSYINSFRGF